MVKAIIVSSKIHFVSVLLKELEAEKIDIKISRIAENNKETKEILEEGIPFLIFFDNAMKSKFKETFFDKYEEQLICIGEEKESKLLSEENIRRTRGAVRRLDSKRLRKKIQNEVTSIGYKVQHKGTNYLVDTILYICTNDKETSYNLQGMIYPKLAEKYGKTVYNIKSSITKATEAMYCECDAKILEQYFKFCDDTKPTVKQVVYTVVGRM